MKLRVFVYKPGESIRQPLTEYLESLGHDVAVVNFPQTCLQYHSPEVICSTTKVCADMIILGTEISPDEGLTMLEKRVAAGCHGAKSNAIICDSLSKEDLARAEEIGCQHFKQPFELSAFGEWLDEVLQKIDRERELSPFTIGGTVG